MRLKRLMRFPSIFLLSFLCGRCIVRLLMFKSSVTFRGPQGSAFALHLDSSRRLCVWLQPTTTLYSAGVDRNDRSKSLFWTVIHLPPSFSLFWDVLSSCPCKGQESLSLLFVVHCCFVQLRRTSRNHLLCLTLCELRPLSATLNGQDISIPTRSYSNRGIFAPLTEQKTRNPRWLNRQLSGHRIFLRRGITHSANDFPRIYSLPGGLHPSLRLFAPLCNYSQERRKK